MLNFKTRSERIANESKKDYWQIIEILTAYVRNNSGIDSYSKDVSLKNVPISMDIQANESTKNKVPQIRTISLDIQAILTVIIRRKYSYKDGETKKLDFKGTNLQKTNLSGANLSGVKLSEVELSGAKLSGAKLSEVNLKGTNLKEANLSKANLSGAKHLTYDQLSKVKTLYNAKLDDELLIPLKEKYPALFEKPEQ